MGGVATRQEANTAYRHLSQHSGRIALSTTPTSPFFVGGVATRRQHRDGNTMAATPWQHRDGNINITKQGSARRNIRQEFFVRKRLPAAVFLQIFLSLLYNHH